MFRSGPNYSKLKTNLRLVINRLKLLEKKKTEVGEKARKDIVEYIATGKIDRARVRVEHIVREDYLVEAMEIVEMYCDLLLARFGLVQTQKELDPGLEESIATIIWVTPRLQADVAELKAVTDQLTAKYSKEFADACHSNQLNNVSEKVMHKMSVQAPPKILVEKYLVEIARTYNVAYEADPTIMQEDEVFLAERQLINLDNAANEAGRGGGQPQHNIHDPNAAFEYPQAPGPAHAPPFTMPGAIPPPPSNYMPNNVHPPPAGFITGPPPMAPHEKNPNMFPDLPDLPSVPGTLPTGSAPSSKSGGSEDVDFDDLTRRFEELKKKK